MSASAVCDQCGGRRVTVDVDISTPLTELIEVRELQLVQRKRSTGLFGLSGKSNISSLAAITCTQCGKTTLYATEPKNLVPDE